MLNIVSSCLCHPVVQQKVMTQMDTCMPPEIDEDGLQAWTLILIEKTIWVQPHLSAWSSPSIRNLFDVQRLLHNTRMNIIVNPGRVARLAQRMARKGLRDAMSTDWPKIP